MLWTETPIHIIDFEGNMAYGIIEYGIATVYGGEIVECYTDICCAEADIDPRETWCHGLRRQDTVDAAPFSTYWELFTKLRQTGPFGAHHAVVESRFIKRYWPYSTEALNYVKDNIKTAEWGPWVDTRVLYQHLLPQIGKYSLGQLIARLGLIDKLEGECQKFCPPGRQQFHCALYDAIASALLLINLSKSKISPHTSTQWLVAQSQGNAKARQDSLQQRLF